MRRVLMAGVCAALMLAACGGGGATGRPGSSAWRVVRSATQQRLYDAACLSRSTCLAVGEKGTIVGTGDGGASWRAQANPLQGSSSVLYRIACVGPGTCYVVARPDTILVTHDGGGSWTSHVLPIHEAGPALTDAACLRDHPAGTNRATLCRLGLLDVACINAAQCYAVDTSPLAYDDQSVVRPAPAEASSVWMTADGGATWSAQPVPSGVPCNGDCSGSFRYPLVWITCLTDGVCRAGGGQVLHCGHCGFANAVLVSSGPGADWSCAVRAASACTSFAPDAADCPTGTTCYGIDSTSPLGQGSTVWRSTDAGGDWEQVGTGLSPNVLSRIACVDARTCYIAGSRGTIVALTGGSRLSTPAIATKKDLYGITCAGPTTCFAVGDDGTIVARH